MPTLKRLGIVLMPIALLASVLPPATAERDPDFIAQLKTVAAMRAVAQHIEVHRPDYSGKPPPTLDDLVRVSGMASFFTKDGWGRPLYYYRTSDAYVLISFGKDGSPTPQVVPVGQVETSVGDFHGDVVIINGEWAQAPGDSGR